MSQSRSLKRSALLALAAGPVAAALWTAPAQAQLTWDPNFTGGSDNSGNWDTTVATNSDWYNGTSDVTWVNTDTATIGSGGTAGTITLDDNTVSTAGITFNAVGSGSYLIKANGGDTLTLSGAGTITVATGANSPTISAPIAGSVGLTLIGPGTLNLSGSNSYTTNTVLNSGTLNLNTGGTLGAAANGLVFGTPGAAPGGSPTPLTNVATLNLNVGATVGSFDVNTNSTSTNTMTIAGGQILQDNGSFVVSLNPKLGSVSTHTNLAISGGGTLSVSNSSNPSFQVGVGETDGSNPSVSAAQTFATLDMSGLSNFIFTGGTSGTGEFDVGFGAHGQGTAILANTSNTIVAATARVGDSTDLTASGNAGGGTSTLSLGAGTNVINANTINVGIAKDVGVLNFVTNAGTLTINNEAGTGGAVLNVGMGASGSSGVNGSVNLDGHNVTATFSTMNIGNRSNSTTSSATGSFAFDTGTVNATAAANALTLAHEQGTTSAAGGAIGSITTGDASAGGTNVGVLNINVGNTAANQNIANASSGTSSSATGTFSVLYNGVANVNGSLISSVTAGGTNNTVATVTVAGGTLNMMGSNLGQAAAASNTFTVTNPFGTIANIASIDSTGGITNGGTLNIGGTNTWNGATSITSAGTVTLLSSLSVPTVGGVSGGSSPNVYPAARLYATNSSVTANSIVTINTGATLVAQAGTRLGTTGAASTNGASLVLNSGGTLSLEDGAVGTFSINEGASYNNTALTLSGGNVDLDLGTTGADEIEVIDAAGGVGNISVSGTNTISLNILAGTTSLPTGTLPVIATDTGSILGETTGGFVFNASDPNYVNGTTESYTTGGTTYTITLADPASAEALVITAVPEPASIGLLSLGGMALLSRRGRKRGRA